MDKLLESHWKVVKNILRYLKGTINFGIKYPNDFGVELEGYSNSDWVGNHDDKRSTSGYVFNLGSMIVAWSNKKQPIGFLSSTEAEYKYLYNATCEAI